MKKIMIFGGGGFVGGNLAKIALNNNIDVTIVGRQYAAGIDEATWLIEDMTHKDKVSQMIEAIQPDVVINVAAMANIDYAQRHQEQTTKINVHAAATLAKACKSCHAKYIFMSSDAVYEGNEREYSETSPTNPVNFYGKTKADAEKKILAVYDNVVILRLSLVLGMPVTGGNSFVASLIKKLTAEEAIYCPIEEIRTPIDVYTLCHCILEFADNAQKGIYNIGATESLNRYDITKRLAEKLGLDASYVKKTEPALKNTNRAPRHRNGIICIKKAESILKTKLRNIEDTLSEAIKTLT